MPPAAPLNPWKWPTRHWAIAGPFQGKIFLVMIDAHSKWIEAVCTSTTVVIDVLRTAFAKFGLPETTMVRVLPSRIRGVLEEEWHQTHNFCSIPPGGGGGGGGGGGSMKELWPLEEISIKW